MPIIFQLCPSEGGVRATRISPIHWSCSTGKCIMTIAWAPSVWVEPGLSAFQTLRTNINVLSETLVQRLWVFDTHAERGSDPGWCRSDTCSMRTWQVKGEKTRFAFEVKRWNSTMDHHFLVSLYHKSRNRIIETEHWRNFRTSIPKLFSDSFKRFVCCLIVHSILPQMSTAVRSVHTAGLSAALGWPSISSLAAFAKEELLKVTKQLW